MSKRTRKRYTPEFKREAVSLVTQHGYSKAEAGRRLFSSLERPNGTSSGYNTVWHGYAPYNPPHAGEVPDDLPQHEQLRVCW